MTPEPDEGLPPVDEFDWIAQCLTPLAGGAPEALGLADDAAVLPARPGFDLVISKDALVEGVHFLPDDPLDEVARKLLRVNLSDLAAKGAAPYGYFLATAWPERHGWVQRRAFAAGLAEDQARFGLALFGGDTVATPGPFLVSLTILGWVPAGTMVRRGGAQAGDALLVTGTIGDGVLGLEAAQGGLRDLSTQDRAALNARYHRPEPRLGLGDALRQWAHATADVSDGLIADAGHIAAASGLGLDIDLARAPLSAAAAHWLAGQARPVEGRVRLATGGDDYEVLCAAPQAAVAPLTAAAAKLGLALTQVGAFRVGKGVAVTFEGRTIAIHKPGYRHR